jgi:alcohol dehydrogenase
MKALRLAEPRKFERIELPEPDGPGPGEALVQTHVMGVCGTDLSGYLGKMPFFSYPRIPGHELGVEVLAVGEGVTNVRPGDRCSVEPYINNPDSFASRRGSGNCCQNLQVLGVHRDGGLRSRWTLPARKLHKSESLSYEQLALVETLAIGCHATDRGAPKPAEHILIIGAGPIGLATLEFTRLSGAIVTVMDMVPSRLEFCKKQYGVEHTVVFKGDGSELEQMNQITGGEFYIGITTDHVSFPHVWMHAREMTVKGSRNAMPGDFHKIIKLIERGTINTAPWITHRTKFDQVIDVFESFTKPETGVIKAVIEVG